MKRRERVGERERERGGGERKKGRKAYGSKIDLFLCFHLRRRGRRGEREERGEGGEGGQKHSSP